MGGMADSPSQTLMDCMEQFGEAEPEAVLVIWTTGDDIRYSQSSDTIMSLGMMEAVRAGVLNRFKANQDTE